MAKLFKPSKQQAPQSAQLLIDKQGYDGRGIARHQGKLVFVSGALPGETVITGKFHVHSRYSESDTQQVIHSSAVRVLPECKFYNRCGGCSLQHQQSVAQVQFKQNSVLEQMQRLGGLIPTQIAEPLLSMPWEYRSRARLGIDRQGRLAFRERDSSNFVAIDSCHVLTQTLQHLLAAMQDLPAAGKGCGISHIELVEADSGTAVVIRHTRPMTTLALNWLAQLQRSTSTSVWLQGEKSAELSELTGIVSDPRLHYRLPAFAIDIGFHPQDFTQINRDINHQMVTQALAWLDLQGTETVLDLFCGVGNFTLPLAQKAARVIGVEALESMVLRGRENAVANRLANCEFIALDLSMPVPEDWNQHTIDAVLLDPPRAGAQQAVVWIAQVLKVPRIVYISCDPASLSRDAALLEEQGYRLERLGIMDMFPQTAHVESMALFVRQ